MHEIALLRGYLAVAAFVFFVQHGDQIAVSQQAGFGLPDLCQIKPGCQSTHDRQGIGAVLLAPRGIFMFMRKVNEHAGRMQAPVGFELWHGMDGAKVVNDDGIPFARQQDIKAFVIVGLCLSKPEAASVTGPSLCALCVAAP
ncbi:hypothetical protein ACFSHQ_24035 [Gemmobacter lanyuensis]